MSSKPKASEFKAGEQERFLSETARAEKSYFNEKYGPLLKKAGVQAEKEDLGSVARGTAGADTMQALTGPRNLSLGSVSSIDAAAERAIAAGQQQIKGSTVGLQTQRQRQLGVLGTARGQQADTTSGLAAAAKIESTRALQDAQARQTMREARMNFGRNVAGAVAAKGMDNLASYEDADYKADGRTEPSFFTKLSTPFDGYYKKSTNPEDD